MTFRTPPVILLIAFVFTAGSRVSIQVPPRAHPMAEAATSSPSSIYLGQYGGHPALRSTPTGYFSKAWLSDRWWLVDPEGNVFYAAGVDYVNPNGYTSLVGTNPYSDQMKSEYGNPVDETAWSADVLDRLKSWGYNTVGSYSSAAFLGKIPHTADLLPMNQLREAAYATNGHVDQYPILWEDSRWDVDYRRYFFDVFHPQFDTTVRSYIASEVAARGYASDRWLIGYLVDNELPLWKGRSTVPGSPWHTGNTLADVFVALPRTAYGKQEWVNELRSTYSSIAALNAAWKTSYSSFDQLLDVTSLPTSGAIQVDKSNFLRRILDKYFSTVSSAIKAADPNHLYLGSRLVVHAVDNPTELYDEIAKYADAVSINYYIWTDMSYDQLKAEMDGTFAGAYRGKPILITEYSFAGRDSGQPATHPNGAVVDTQEERARLYGDYRSVSVESPFVVGDLWWDYVDPPREGSSWGHEDSNLGLVDNEDRPYLRLLYLISKANSSIYARRGLPAQSNRIISSVSYNVLPPNIPVAGIPVSRASAPVNILDARSSIGFSHLPDGAGYRLYLPTVFKQYSPAPPVEIDFSLSVPINSLRLEVFDGNTVQAERKRVISLGSLQAGGNKLTWDGTDDLGNRLGVGTYYYVLKVTTGTGQSDYAFGIISM